MRRLTTSLVTAATIIAATAQVGLAADMARPVYKATPAVMATAYNWTGFYIGGHVGWAWVKEESTVIAEPDLAFALGSVAGFNRDGFLAGGQVGFNWQTGNWVFGIEGQYSWANVDATVTTASVLIPGFIGTATATNDWFATLAGRIGYAQANWLAYVKGGIAWTEAKYGGSATGVPNIGAATLASISDTRTGWMVGAGVEWGLWDNWSAKIEYNFMDFGTQRYTFTTATPLIVTGATLDFDQNVHLVKLGLNYRFGDFGKGPVGKGPVVSRY